MKTLKDLEKHDPVYVAKLEQAIREKYGEEAVTNPKALWTKEQERDYLEQKEELREKKKHNKFEKIEHEGFLIKKKLLTKDRERVCPECELYSFDERDDLYMIKHGCCYVCYIKHFEDRE